MKYIKHILTVLLLTVVISSCDTDFLSTEPLTEYSDGAVWSDPALVETYVNQLYYNLEIPFVIDMLASYVDEAHFTPDWGVRDFNNCLLTPDQIPGWEVDWFGPNTYRKLWAPLFKKVRGANIFFAKIDEVPFDDDLIDGKTLKDRLTGEAHFLRANYYFTLVCLYGGVPIIKEPYTLSDDFLIARNSYEECINFIVEDLDQAASLLPEEHSGENDGRATKGAAMAFKARVLLYAASELHNNNSLYSGYSNPELLGYTSGSSEDRWIKARDAAKAVMDLGMYDLYMSDPASPEEAEQNIINLFIAKDTEEDIFKRYFISDIDENWDGYNPGIYLGPNGYHNWGNNTPLGQLVDSYEFQDGTAFSWVNPDHQADPYVNRDPRFYATVLYEGAKWRPRPSDAAVIDPEGVIQVGVWKLPDGTERWGLDTRKGPIEDWNGGYTGYYCRKFIDPSFDSQYDKQDVPWRFIRYAEVLLNYAEACIELGEDEEARRVLNMIRQRAAMPEITESGEALKERYRNERRVEMAYEEHRFHDVRRWAIGNEAYVPAEGVDVVYELVNGQTAEEPTITPMTFETRAWDDKAYFFPIYRDEMNKNELLVQNPFY